MMGGYTSAQIKMKEAFDHLGNRYQMKKKAVANGLTGAFDAVVDDAVCAALKLAVPALKGGQSRMISGQGYLSDEGPMCTEPSECDEMVVAHLNEKVAFVGLTERYEESVCAFHLSMGGPTTHPAELSTNARSSLVSGIDWHAETKRCNVTSLDNDLADSALFLASQRRLDETIADIEKRQPGAMEACRKHAPLQ